MDNNSDAKVDLGYGFCAVCGSAIIRSDKIYTGKFDPASGKRTFYYTHQCPQNKSHTFGGACERTFTLVDIPDERNGGYRMADDLDYGENIIETAMRGLLSLFR